MPLVSQPLDRRGRLGHLQQREHPLLHPGAAAGDDRQQRTAGAPGAIGGAGDLFADDDTHAAAHEREVEYRQDDRLAAQPRRAGHDRVGLASPDTRFSQALPVGNVIGKGEGIGGNEIGVGFAKRAAIGDVGDRGSGGATVVETADIADPVAGVRWCAGEHLGAARAAGRRRQLREIDRHDGIDHRQVRNGNPEKSFHHDPRSDRPMSAAQSSLYYILRWAGGGKICVLCTRSCVYNGPLEHGAGQTQEGGIPIDRPRSAR